MKSRGDHGSTACGARRTKSEGATPQPLMILKDFPEGVWKSFRIMEVAAVEQPERHDHRG
jgi:hypothetical protein